MAKRGLGRGLDALMQDNMPDTEELQGKSGSLQFLHISDIEPNKDQARKSFDESALAELADSISQHGLLEPIIVRARENGYYEIIAGERRWRASRIAGLTEIPAVVRNLTDEQAALLSLIENLQREDLNPVEEALGYRDLIERFSLTQETAAEKVGKSRSQVTNMLRILRLPDEILQMIQNGSLSIGHARCLLSLEETADKKTLLAIAKKCVEDGWSVRQMEAYIKSYKENPKKPKRENPVAADYYRKLERQISDSMGRKASIQRNPNGKGKLCLAFSSPKDLEILIRNMCGKNFFDEE